MSSLDQQGRISLVNQAAQWLLESDVTDIEGRPLAEVVRDHDLLALAAVTASSRQIHQTEVELLHQRRFLRVIRGDADRDRDGRIGYSELQEYLVGSVIRDGQTPQLRPSGKPVVERPIFGRSVAPGRRGGTGAKLGLRVRLEPSDPELRALLEGEAGIVVTFGEYDLEVRRQPGRFRVYLAAGAELGGKRLADRAAVVGLLRRRARAHRIAHLIYPGQDMRVELLLEPEQGSVYYRGEELSVGIRPGEAAWLLLLAIDPGGGVISVYPFDRSQARRAGRGETVRAVTLAAVGPFGTDLLEAFAFREKPAGYDDWIGRFDPLSEAETRRLYQMLSQRAGAPGRGRASRILYTVDR